jgi:hypothetical protein
MLILQEMPQMSTLFFDRMSPPPRRWPERPGPAPYGGPKEKADQQKKSSETGTKWMPSATKRAKEAVL